MRNYLGEKWLVISTESCDFHAYTSGFFYMLQIFDMEQTALLPFRRKACWGFFPPWRIRRFRPGLNPRTWVPEASTLPLDHRSRFIILKSTENIVYHLFCVVTPKKTLAQFLYNKKLRLQTAKWLTTSTGVNPQQYKRWHGGPNFFLGGGEGDHEKSGCISRLYQTYFTRVWMLCMV